MHKKRTAIYAQRTYFCASDSAFEHKHLNSAGFVYGNKGGGACLQGIQIVCAQNF